MRILGIDPALRVTGYGAIAYDGSRARLIEAGVVAPNPREALPVRLARLHAGIAATISGVQPDIVVIEELYTTYRNPSTAIAMAHARGVICLACGQAGLDVRTLGHAHVKRALAGSGSASKEQVNAMVVRLLGLRAAPKPLDVSDALALALAYSNMHGRRIA